MREVILKGHFIVFLALLAFLPAAGKAFSDVSMDNEGMGMGMGIPLDSFKNDANLEICPHGAKVIGMFLSAWQAGDYRAMYELIDEKSKEDYPFESARFDFQFMEFKEYTISSVRRNGENFDFMLSYGDWESNNKEIIKMTVDGSSFKIIMPQRGEVYKRSIESSF